MARTNLNPNNTPKNEGVEKQNQNPQNAQSANSTNNASKKPQGDNKNPDSTPKNGGVNFDKEFVIVNLANANKKLIGLEGKIIEFNDKGEATVGMADAMRFQKCFEGYTVKEK